MTRKIIDNKVFEIADFFVVKANQNKSAITNKKVQKLVYYAQVWSLVLKDEKLFTQEIEAWVHGPVIRDLYDRYKKFGFTHISDSRQEEEIKKSYSEDTLKLLENIWKVYGGFDSTYLETLTHSEEPWRRAREGMDNDKNSENVIDLELAKKYYSEKLKEKRSNS